jgi:hypothetical protein
MKLLQTIVFLAFYALASAEKLSNILRMNEEEAPRKASVRRRAKKDGSNGGEGPDDGQQDRSVGYDSCVELADVPPGILAATTAGDQCLTENACNNGCCRLFNFLICDEINDWFRLEVRLTTDLYRVLPSMPVATIKYNILLTFVFFFCLLFVATSVFATTLSAHNKVLSSPVFQTSPKPLPPTTAVTEQMILVAV